MIMTQKTKSTVCLFVTAFIWGAAFVAQKVGSEHIEPFTFGGMRFALGTLSLIPVALLFERDTGDDARRKRTWVAGVLGGLIIFVAANLQQFGVALTGSAGKSGFITGPYIVLVPILGIFRRKMPGWSTWLGAALAFGGLYLLSAPEGLQSADWGDAVLLIGALFWAVHIILVDHFAHDVNPIRFSMIQFCTCSALSLICAFSMETVALTGLVDGLWPLLFCGLMSVGIAYTLQIFGQRGVEPSKAAIIFSLEAVFAALCAAVLIGELMTVRMYIGCLFIFAGILVSQLVCKRGRKKTDGAADK